MKTVLDAAGVVEQSAALRQAGGPSVLQHLPLHPDRSACSRPGHPDRVAHLARHQPEPGPAALRRQVGQASLDNHGMGTIFKELIRRFNEENNEEAGEHGTPRDAVTLIGKLIFRAREFDFTVVAGPPFGTYTRSSKTMARADLILTLIKASRQGNDLQVRKAVEAMAADERAKNHTILADRLLAQLPSGNGRHGRQTPLLARSASSPLVAETLPARCLADLILSVEAAETVGELVAEQHRADLLRSYSLEPRNRVLLAGPPGNGKTTLAEALAHALNVPFLVVRYEAVIGSYLGETAQRIAQVFEHAKSRHCVLFFDEFDSVGKERGDLHETGEIKRVVSSLLLQIDALPVTSSRLRQATIRSCSTVPSGAASRSGWRCRGRHRARSRTGSGVSRSGMASHSACRPAPSPNDCAD